MASYTKEILSASINGKPISVAATSTPGTTIHTAQSGTTGKDVVWLYAVNQSASNVKLTIEFGGTTTAEQIEVTVDAESGLILVVPGLPINNGLVVSAFCGSANAINITGYVNRVA